MTLCTHGAAYTSLLEAPTAKVTEEEMDIAVLVSVQMHSCCKQLVHMVLCDCLKLHGTNA